MREARDVLDQCDVAFKGMMDDFGDYKKKPTNISIPLEKLYQRIADHPEGITLTQLEQQTSWVADELEKYLGHLLRMKKIHQVIEKKTKPKTLYLVGPPPPPKEEDS